jgi:hypothetical protein
MIPPLLTRAQQVTTRRIFANHGAPTGRRSADLTAAETTLANCFVKVGDHSLGEEPGDRLGEDCEAARLELDIMVDPGPARNLVDDEPVKELPAGGSKAVY